MTEVSARIVVERKGDAHFGRAWSFPPRAVNSHAHDGWRVSETEHGVG